MRSSSRLTKQSFLEIKLIESHAQTFCYQIKILCTRQRFIINLILAVHRMSPSYHSRSSTRHDSVSRRSDNDC